jgi:outer membrane protein TolC
MLVWSAAALLGGCATYHALPLARGPDLAPRLSLLRATVPPLRPGAQPRRIDLSRPLSLDDIGLLAVLNDPALRSERGERGLAEAGLLQASLLPNPTASLSFEPLVSAGISPSWTAVLTENVRAILTYHTRVESAHFALGQVDADLLWREWQVAQQARVLALNLYWGGRSVTLARRELGLLGREVRAVRSATKARILGLAALAPLLAAQAAAQQFLDTANLSELRGWQDLDALLGLAPGVRFAIATPVLPPLPSSLKTVIGRLPDRRPDLVALRLGYRSADENVRTAIIGQFPAMMLGGEWDQDNTDTRNAGPTAAFAVPIFDRNQGQIAVARATRRLLHEQYQSRLDQAVGTARALAARIRQLAGDVRRARREARVAESMSRAARKAYAEENLDQRALVDYETTALERRIDANALELSLGEARVALTVDLGLGLPRIRMALPAHPRTL